MYRAALLVALALLTAESTACRPSQPARAPAPPRTTTTVSATPIETRLIESVEYLPGKPVTIVRPVGDGPWATVVVYHGVGVELERMYPLAEKIAERGVVVFIPEWDAPAPSDNDVGTVAQAWDEAAAAMRFARTNAPRYGARSERVIAVGHSWGASVAAALGLSGDEFGVGGASEGVSARPDAVVALDGPMDTRVMTPGDSYRADREAWDRMNPTMLLKRPHVGEGPEFRLLIGGTWPESDASNASFAELLEAKGGTVSIETLDKQHMEMALPLTPTVDAVLGVIDSTMR